MGGQQQCTQPHTLASEFLPLVRLHTILNTRRGKELGRARKLPNKGTSAALTITNKQKLEGWWRLHEEGTLP